MKFKIVHYINQFYAGHGGEDKADWKPESHAEAMGPGLEIKRSLEGTNAELVGTVVCGDGFYGEHMDEARSKCLDMIRAFKPDLVIAGPAFNAGRYGVACGDISATVIAELGIPAVCGMYKENPGVEMYASKGVYIIPTPDSARGMKEGVAKMVKLALKILAKEAMGPARVEGYFSRGIRKCFFAEESGAERAVKMMLARLRGEEFLTEYEMPSFKHITPAPPLKDLKKATIALITSGGIVPCGNPDRLRVSSAESFHAYDITGVDALSSETYESVHGGYDRQWANENPNVVLPVDAMRELEREGVFGKLHNTIYTTTGTGTSVQFSESFGKAIGDELKKAEVSAAILTST